jgi:hypothetical protein
MRTAKLFFRPESPLRAGSRPGFFPGPISGGVQLRLPLRAGTAVSPGDNSGKEGSHLSIPPEHSRHHPANLPGKDIIQIVQKCRRSGKAGEKTLWVVSHNFPLNRRYSICIAINFLPAMLYGGVFFFSSLVYTAVNFLT